MFTTLHIVHKSTQLYTLMHNLHSFLPANFRELGLTPGYKLLPAAGTLQLVIQQLRLRVVRKVPDLDQHRGHQGVRQDGQHALLHPPIRTGVNIVQVVLHQIIRQICTLIK